MSGSLPLLTCPPADRPSTGYLPREAARQLGETLRARQPAATIAFCNGCFDLLHAGHVQLLECAQNAADVVIVGLNADESIRALKGSRRPVHPLAARLRLLLALRCVDYVIPFHDLTPADLIHDLRPDVLVRGDDPTSPRPFAGETDLPSWGGRLILVPLLPGLSTTAALTPRDLAGVE